MNWILLVIVFLGALFAYAEKSKKQSATPPASHQGEGKEAPPEKSVKLSVQAISGTVDKYSLDSLMAWQEAREQEKQGNFSAVLPRQVKSLEFQMKAQLLLNGFPQDKTLVKN